MRILSIIFPLFYSIATYCQDNPLRADSITVKGITTQFKNKNETTIIEKVKIHAYQYNTKYTTFNSDKNGYFEFNIPLNSYIVLAFEKEDYIVKRVLFDTRTSAKLKKINPFDLEIVMLKYFNGINYNDLDFPITRVEYDEEIKDFNYASAYTEMMLKKQSKILLNMGRKSNQF